MNVKAINLQKMLWMENFVNISIKKAGLQIVVPDGKKIKFAMEMGNHASVIKNIFIFIYQNIKIR